MLVIQTIATLIVTIRVLNRTPESMQKQAARHLLRLVVMVCLFTITILIIGLAATIETYTLRYLRNLAIITLFFSIFRYLANINAIALPHIQNPRVLRIAYAIYAVAFLSEFGYTWYRLRSVLPFTTPAPTYSDFISIAARPAIWQLPLLLAVLLSYIAILNGYWRSRPDQLKKDASVSLHINAFEIYKFFLFSATFMLITPIVMLSPIRNQIRSWMVLIVDIGLLLSLLGMSLIVLRDNKQMPSLNTRLVASAIFSFLLLITIVSWFWTASFIQHVAPDINLTHLNPHLDLGAENFLEAQVHRRSFHETQRPLIWIAVLGSLITGLSLSRYYNYVLTNPLTNILSSIQAVKSGNYQTQITHYRKDELGQIATEFNSMAQRISRTSISLKRYQSRLEEIVEQRTESLLIETEQRKTLEIHQAIQAERERIARETHDGLMQRLAGTRLRIAHWHRLINKNPQDLHQELDELEHQLTLGTIELRQLINDLNHDFLQHGLNDALVPVIYHAEKAYDLVIDPNIEIDETKLNKQQSHELFRIVQEAISNCGKHARATNLWITAQTSTDNLNIHLTIQDDGKGFDTAKINTEQHVHLGLKNIKTRTDTLNGTVSIESEFTKGTMLNFVIPYNADDQE